MSVLHLLVSMRYSIAIAEAYLEGGEDPNTRDVNGDTPLHIIASNKEESPDALEENEQFARLLITFGAAVNARNNIGRTPLIIAVQARNRRMTEFLLNSYALIDAKDYYGNAALHYAVLQCGSSLQNGDRIHKVALQLLKALLRFDPHLNTRNIQNQTPLMLAVQKRDFRVVQELSKRNVSMDLKDLNNESAMHYALDQENVDPNIVYELVRHECRFNVVNMYYETPMTVYIRRLLSAPADELETAKQVFKLFLFLRNGFTSPEMQAIERISKETNCQFSRFIEVCRNEILQMQCDNLTRNCSVYTFAAIGFYSRTFCESHAPLEAFDAALYKLMNCEYPVYKDLILSGICSPYMNKKYAEICSFVENTGTEFLNYDTLYLVSFYLSPMDMLNMMIAWNDKNRCRKYFSCLGDMQCFRSCSVLEIFQNVILNFIGKFKF